MDIWPSTEESDPLGASRVRVGVGDRGDLHNVCLKLGSASSMSLSVVVKFVGMVVVEFTNISAAFSLSL